MSQVFILTNVGPSRCAVQDNCIRFINALPTAKQWKVEISAYRKTRTVEQNAALWGLAYPLLVEHTGHTSDEIHQWMCCNFFGTHEYEINGVKHSRPVRTTTTNESGKNDVLDWQTFGNFYANVQRVGAEAGVYIPDPDPALSSKWNDPRAHHD